MEPKADAGTWRTEGIGSKEAAKEIARRIDAALIAKDMNRSQLAARLNKTDSWISQVMSGKIRLAVPLLFEIAAALGVDVASLLPGPNPTSKVGGETAKEFIRQLVREEIRQDPTVLFCTTCPLRKTRPTKKKVPPG